MRGSDASSPEAALRRRIPAPIPGDTVAYESMDPDPQMCPVLINGKENLCRPVGVIVSTYRIVVVPHSDVFPVIEIPAMCIDEIKEPKRAPYLLNKKQEPGEEVSISSKLPWDIRLGFRLRRDSQGLYNVLNAMRKLLDPTVGQNSPLERLFAFDHAGPYREAYQSRGHLEDGWTLFDMERELARQTGSGDAEKWVGAGVGVNLRPWFRICHLDKEDEGFSPTYPSRFVVPRSATDKLIRAVSQFRSRQRIPIVSFVFLRTGAVLTRSSQPLPGLNSNRSQADEVMCESLLSQAYIKGGTPIPSAFHEDSDSVSPTKKKGLTNAPPSLSAAPPSLTGAPPSLAPGAQPSLDNTTAQMKQLKEKQKRPPTVIFDARSPVAATGNRARGGGYESSKYYSCKVHFLHMGNIHAVKDSWVKCKKLIEKFNNVSSVLRDNVPGPQGPNVNFFSEWEKTGWVLHIQRIIFGSVRIVEEMTNGVSCLVHCSDGWDRTSQLTSTAMLLVDPYFRTIRGFATLIEKEWCVYGHKFAERSGHQVPGRLNAARFKEGQGNETDEQQDTTGIAKHTKRGSGIEPSPVFLQWLDALYQIMRQFPTAFEFTPALLEFIVDNVYSCRFGTFLCNFDKERIEEKVKENTISVWTEVLRLVAIERAEERHHFINPHYAPPTAVGSLTQNRSASRSRTPSPTEMTPLSIENAAHYLELNDIVLRPSCNGKRMAFWESFYLKHDCSEFELAIPEDHRRRRQPSMPREDEVAGIAESSDEEPEEAQTSSIKMQMDESDLPATLEEAAELKKLRDELKKRKSEATKRDEEIVQLKTSLQNEKIRRGELERKMASPPLHQDPEAVLEKQVSPALGDTPPAFNAPPSL